MASRRFGFSAGQNLDFSLFFSKEPDFSRVNNTVSPARAGVARFRSEKMSVISVAPRKISAFFFGKPSHNKLR